MPAYRYLVRGRVQGVGYRYFVLRQADALAGLEGRLREGPAFAEVTGVERETIEPRGDAGFHVR